MLITLLNTIHSGWFRFCFKITLKKYLIFPILGFIISANQTENSKIMPFYALFQELLPKPHGSLSFNIGIIESKFPKFSGGVGVCHKIEREKLLLPEY